MSSSLTIALTGGIASGKTFVSDLLAEHGAAIVDTDVVAREVVAKDTPGLAAIVEHFGAAILNRDGSLDRAALRDIVFREPDERRVLESITHPLIRERCVALASQADGHYLVFVVPLLVGSGFIALADRVLLIDCAVQTQIERLMRRDGETFEGAQRIIAAQPERRARLAIADDVLQNDTDKADLGRRVLRLHRYYLSLTGDRPAEQ